MRVYTYIGFTNRRNKQGYERALKIKKNSGQEIRSWLFPESPQCCYMYNFRFSRKQICGLSCNKLLVD